MTEEQMLEEMKKVTPNFSERGGKTKRNHYH